jgi:hypothetical protein
MGMYLMLLFCYVEVSLGLVKIAKSAESDKEVTSETDWCPKKSDRRKNGHQWSRLVPKKV